MADASPLEQVLTDAGPLDTEQIRQRLGEVGAPDPDAVVVQLIGEIAYPARQLADDRWVWLPAVLAGRVFTHRVGADEIAYDLLTVTPDLDPITTLCDHPPYQELTDGSPVAFVMEEFDAELLEERGIPQEAVDELGGLLLAQGTLDALGVTAGDLVGLGLTASGLTLQRVSELSGDGSAAGLAAVAADPGHPAEPTYFDQAVWSACVADPTLFTQPVAPLAEIADAAGLVHHGEWLAPAGFDFDSWDAEQGSRRLAIRHGIEPDDAFALYLLIGMTEQLTRALDSAAADDESVPDSAATSVPDSAATSVPAPQVDADDDPVGSLGSHLADPLIAELLVTETVGRGASPAALGMLAETLEARVPRAARVATRWLQAVAHERLGDIDAAERALLAAETMDPDWPLPLLDLARFASDRSDAERGLSLLRRAGITSDHPLLALLERHRAQPRTDVGRNEPCWCGSGRKYKKCHLGRETLPLSERAGWLYTKAAQHVVLTGWDDLLGEVAYERSRHCADDRAQAMRDALDDPLTTDLVLFEGGAFADFLEVRGSLLPGDERLLAQQWLLIVRSVFEVEQVQPGRTVTVRDVRTGDRHEVTERTASRHLKPAQLICTRVLPCDGSAQFFGGIEPVALHERGPLIELLDNDPDPVVLVAQLSRRFAPPRLVNTEGDPLMVCEASVGVDDHHRVEALLDRLYDRVGDESRWLEKVPGDDMARIRAALVLDDGILRIETNSERRLDRVLSALTGADPAIRVLHESRRPLDKAAAPSPDAGPRGIEDAERAPFLEQFIRDYETKWLDEPIPALDGRTPRQAAEDPTRRADLIMLLNSFPAQPGGMDVDRIRVALGLASPTVDP